MNKLFLLFVCAICLLTVCYNTNLSSTQLESILYADDWLEQIERSGWMVHNQAEGYFSSISNNKQNIYIISKAYDESSLFHYSRLAIEIEENVFFFNFGKEYHGSFADVISVGDVDGDGMDEVAILSTIGQSGGAGQYEARVFKIKENSCSEIFYSSSKEPFNTGFTNILCDNYIITIKNAFTNYEANFDLREKYEGIFYDDKGNLIKSANVFCDSFNHFNLIDIEKDGIYEVACSQYVSLYDHSDYIGEAKSVLKFNVHKKNFEVYDASFCQELSQSG